ncbi:mediator of RNA polymerase ii transcription subunit 20a [Phtheirospermum japonicum]|uniref:Mediator of RNA polymerase II transcription subunit 20 n=1 Tax=Phtheirospermum japonicum TaxID=374723 RepID=A0A830BUF3_9LAMI|nr:mediator of RNA polymerase ii transcription subunit 20a [Phtheirospermum japonicum]
MASRKDVGNPLSVSTKPWLEPGKYFLVIRGQRLVVEAESNIQMIMEKLQSYKTRVALSFEGSQYQLGDFQLRVGKVVPVHSESLRGIVMEMEYLPISSWGKSHQVMGEFFDLWQEALSKRSLPGHFVHIEPNFADYGLPDQYTLQHTAVQYASITAQMIATSQVAYQYPYSNGFGSVSQKGTQEVGPVQVAFGYGGSSSTIKSYKGGAYQTLGKEYKEPWDYYTSYPVTLPLRRPYSGNPEEFGEDTQRSGYDEYATNPAVELGLLDENPENSMFFFQLPTNMPTVKPSANAEANEPEKTPKPAKFSARGTGVSRKPCNLEELPAGLMGKMLVYKSGAVKLKLGEMIYDVSSGLNCVFAQDVLAINTEEKHCCNIGELSKRAVITPDIDSMLDAMSL